MAVGDLKDLTRKTQRLSEEIIKLREENEKDQENMKEFFDKLNGVYKRSISTSVSKDIFSENETRELFDRVRLMIEFETQLGIEFNSVSGLKEFKKMVMNKESIEYWELLIISSILRPNANYFQIGTRNEGLTCLFVANMGAEVIFTESHPKGYDSVVENINKNPKLKNKIFSYKTCIFGNAESSPKEYNLYHPNGKKDSMHSAYWGKEGDEETWYTHCWPLKKFIEHAGVSQIDLLRLDMDGAESVLLGPIKEWIEDMVQKPSLLFNVDRKKFSLSDSPIVDQNVVLLCEMYQFVYTSQKEYNKGFPSPLTKLPTKDTVCDDCSYFLTDTPIKEWSTPTKRI